MTCSTRASCLGLRRGGARHRVRARRRRRAAAVGRFRAPTNATTGERLDAPGRRVIDTSQCDPSAHDTGRQRRHDQDRDEPAPVGHLLGVQRDPEGRVGVLLVHQRARRRHVAGKKYKIKLVSKDDAYDPAQTSTNVDTLINSNKVFALFNTVGTKNNLGIRETVNSDCTPPSELMYEKYAGLALQDRVERRVRARQRQARAELDRVAGDALGERRGVALRRVDDRRRTRRRGPARRGRGRRWPQSLRPLPHAATTSAKHGSERHRPRNLRTPAPRRTSVMASFLSSRRGPEHHRSDERVVDAVT